MKFIDEFANACLDYDLKAGLMVKKGDVVGIANRFGELEDSDETMTADNWIEYYKTDVYDEYLSMYGYTQEDFSSVYTILKNGLEDSVSPDELGTASRIFPVRMEKNPTRVS